MFLTVLYRPNNHKRINGKTEPGLAYILAARKHMLTNVALILNTETGLTTPQFHVKFDERFETVRTNPKMKNLNKWQEKTRIRESVPKFKTKQASKRQRLTIENTGGTIPKTQTASREARKQIEPKNRVDIVPQREDETRAQKGDPETDQSQREAADRSQRETETPHEARTPIQEQLQREEPAKGTERATTSKPSDASRPIASGASRPSVSNTRHMTRMEEDKFLERAHALHVY